MIKIEQLSWTKIIWQTNFLLLVLMLMLLVGSCSDSNRSNPVSGDPGSGTLKGFGVSGLLFENNLVMYFRENDGSRSELFPQMYFTRADEPNFPVFGTFPSQFLLSGGVPREGIPALFNPTFSKPADAGAAYLKENDLVLGAVINGVARAYPENILWWHEIINDNLGGQDVIMSFCPLTGSGLFFKRPENGNSITKLELLPIVETTWSQWKLLYPNSTVVSSATGFGRDYQVYPYSNYRAEDTSPLFPLQTGSIDTRFPEKHPVLGIMVNGKQKAYPFSVLENNPVVNDVVNGKEILIVSDVKNHLVIPYSRNLNGKLLNFEILSEFPFRMKDDQNGSVWNMKGEAISGGFISQKLDQVPAYTAFWFAWAIFWPQTAVYENGSK